MRIFTIRRMFGFALIGAAYVHGKRGGDTSLNSMMDTLRYLWTSAADRLGIEAGRVGGASGSRGEQRPGRTAVERTSERTASSSLPKTGAPNGLSGERTPRPQGT